MGSATATLLALVSPAPPPPDGLTGVEWETVLAMGERHQLLPLLHQRLLPVLDTLPPVAREHLHRIHRESAAQMIFFEVAQAELVRTFRQAGVPVALFKGIPLARALFGDPALRPTVDIDLMVRAADFARSEALLRASGWTLIRSWDIHNNYARSFGGADILVELHRTNQREGEYHLPEARLWQETVEGTDGTIFTREMTLLMLVLHTARHAFDPYRQLVDIAHAVAQWHETLDWDHLVALAEEAGALQMTATVLALAQRDLGAPAPPHPALRERIARPRIRLALRLLPPQRLLGGRAVGIVDRYWLPLANGSWRPALFFFGDILRSPRQMAYIYDLPEDSPLLPLYFVLRPILLARKFLRRLLTR